MPADAAFVRLIERSVRSRGGRILDAPDADGAPNPFRFRFELDGDLFGTLIHVRRITPQEGEGTTHARPAGEWHAQMIFDGDTRGAGQRNYLRTAEEIPSVLFGYVPVGEDEAIVIAAWDPEFHSEYSYSKSLQIREETLEEAARTGLAQQERANGEIIVAFRPEYLPEYLANRDQWHGSVQPMEAAEEEPDAAAPESPPDESSRSGRKRVSGTRAARDVRFRHYIHNNYPGCATCGLTTESLLEAAHIIPVGEAGSDHFSNGLRLCKNCHALFDAGLLLIRPDYQVELSDEVAREFPGDAERLQDDLQGELLLPDLPEDHRPDPEKLQRVMEEH